MTLASKIKCLNCPGENPLIVLETDGKIMAYRYLPGKDRFLTLTGTGSGFGSYSSQVKEGTIEYSGIFFCEAKGRKYPGFLLSHRRGRTGILAELRTIHTVYDFREIREDGEIDMRPSQKIITEGISGAPVFSDLNADGYEDLVLLYVKTGALTKLLELIFDRVVITCQAHLFMPDKQRYTHDPTWCEDVSVPTLSFRDVGVEGLIRLDGDYSGDGRPDMVVYDSDRMLIKRGERDSGFFSSQEVSFKSRPFYHIGGPFPGPVMIVNVDRDASPEIITYGKNIVRIVHVR
jgi:hypothetical protein